MALPSREGIFAHAEARAGQWNGELRSLLIAGLAALVVAVFWQSYASMFELYGRDDYRHGFLILPIAAFMLWRTRATLVRVRIAPWWPGFLLLAAIAVAWLVARAAGLQVVEHAVVVCAVPAIVLGVLGRECFRAAAFPLLFTLTSIPVGDNLVPWLREATADIASWLLRLSGIAMHREGMYLSLSGGDFLIADACAGLNYMTSGVAFALLFAWLAYRGWKRRVVFVGVAALVFLLGNGLRAYIVMAVASATDMRLLAGQDHIVFGTILFGVLLLPLSWIGWRFADSAPTDVSPPAARGAVAPAWVLAVATLAAAGVLKTGSAAQAYRLSASGLPAIALSLPAVAGCEGPLEWRAAWTPVVHRPDSEVRATYDCRGIQVHVFAVKYIAQTQGRELVSAANVLIPPDWAASGSRRDAVLPLAGASAAPVNEVDMEGSRPLLALYWYSVDGEPVRSETAAKLLEIRSALTLRSAASSVYVIAAQGPQPRRDELRELAAHVANAAWQAQAGAP